MEGGAVIIGQIAIIVHFGSVLLGGVDHILQKEGLFRGGMLVDQVEEAFEVDEDEAILEVADYVADRKDLAVED